ncbi:N-6 DNA methylase [Micromonospora sp. S-DT3-3-22]|uniref:N-6 DNA methylase n=1 Tax=Micromonospora sp. S-DT3-3-22 TaxID=2755359 RepID=UPI00188F321B|nr:N-6 DNA methylase [Micromonospora sp. S-DT3-3-22]
MATKRTDVPPTTRAQFGSAIKSARDIMRKDAGLNGDLDRLPQLSWLLFLRAFDTLEEERFLIEGPRFKPAIDERYRWKTWASDQDFSGERLLKFVNDDLLPYLRDLPSSKDPSDPRNIISAVFKEINNRMLSGVLLRDLVDQVNRINFRTSDDYHAIAFLYESILKEMRDAAGDSGEFYTPRPVIKFMVEQTFLKLGESILDPACGTGGFLVEAFEKLRTSANSSVLLAELHANLRGIEKKPLPYLLCVMNLILHHVNSPAVIRDNALIRMLNENKPANRVRVVLTNPPFGGEEEGSVAQRFPQGLRTKETSLLYLLAVIDKLEPGGRCAVVLPNGVLSGAGIGPRVREKLLKECNLHTIVRLSQGVFAPYTPIPANLLFFEKTGPTKETWFYQMPAPEGRRGYSKTKPMRYEEFADCIEWWGGEHRDGRIENHHAWRVAWADIERDDFNLDRPNPSAATGLSHRDPSDLIVDLVAIERQILELLGGLTPVEVATKNVPWSPLSKILTLSADPVTVEEEERYITAGIYSYGRGLFKRPMIYGSETNYRTLYRLHVNQFVFSKLFAWEGALATVTKDFEGLFVSQEFPTFDINAEVADPSYVAHLARWPELHARLRDGTTGMGSRRQRVNVARLLATEVPLPDLEKQRQIAMHLDSLMSIDKAVIEQQEKSKALRLSLLNAAFSSS